MSLPAIAVPLASGIAALVGDLGPVLGDLLAGGLSPAEADARVEAAYVRYQRSMTTLRPRLADNDAAADAAADSLPSNAASPGASP